MGSVRFCKRPVVVEAIQFTRGNGAEIKRWSGGKVASSPVLEPTPDNPTGAYLQIPTLEGTMVARVGAWVVRGVTGEYYPVRDDIFRATYDAWEAEGVSVDCATEIPARISSPVLSLLHGWFAELHYTLWEDYVQVVLDEYDSTKNVVEIRIYTQDFRYSIRAKTNSKGVSYLGCTMSERTPLPGRTGTRGRDLPDGPMTKATWDEIVRAIAGVELLPLAKPCERREMR